MVVSLLPSKPFLYLFVVGVVGVEPTQPEALDLQSRALTVEQHSQNFAIIKDSNLTAEGSRNAPNYTK